MWVSRRWLIADAKFGKKGAHAGRPSYEGLSCLLIFFKIKFLENLSSKNINRLSRTTFGFRLSDRHQPYGVAAIFSPLWRPQYAQPLWGLPIMAVSVVEVWTTATLKPYGVWLSLPLRSATASVQTLWSLRGVGVGGRWSAVLWNNRNIR